MEGIVAAGIGDKLNLVGFFFTLVGLLAAFVGAILMFLGSSISGESVWQNLKKIQGVAEQASIVAPEQWTAPRLLDLSNEIPSTAISVHLAYKMSSSDTRTPVCMTLTTRCDGGVIGYANGGQGNLTMMLDDSRQLYIALSHPEIAWSLAVTGWEDSL
ncbi:hypothetical protein [Pseudomonas sp. 50_B]|uniref:hypothetical protein n=1 Tax=Pseudomonas sp. 50_B TaxID=2813574 RepID=UPI001A9F7749|nr:hypothetical protein [Pseudomonas sp. 50_B]